MIYSIYFKRYTVKYYSLLYNYKNYSDSVVELVSTNSKFAIYNFIFLNNNLEFKSNVLYCNLMIAYKFIVKINTI